MSLSMSRTFFTLTSTRSRVIILSNTTTCVNYGNTPSFPQDIHSRHPYNFSRTMRARVPLPEDSKAHGQRQERSPRSFRPAHWVMRHSGEDIVADNPAVRLAPEKVKTYSLRTLKGHDRKPESDIIVGEGLLRGNSVMVLGGPPKAFKSFMLDTILLCLVTGQNLFNAFRSNHGRIAPAFGVSKPQRVLLFEQEVGEDDLEDRLLPMVMNLPPELQDLVFDNFYTHSLDHTLQIDTVAGMNEIERIVKEVKPTVVAFDPLIEFHTSDENSTWAMAKVLHNLDELRWRNHFAAIMNHHEGKESAVPREGPNRLRGNSVLFGKGDSFLMLSIWNRPLLQVKLDFTIRRGKPIPPMYLQFDDSMRAQFLCWDNDPKKKEKIAKLRSEGSDSFTIQ